MHKEQDAPWQVVLGSMETPFCVLVSLALWLELLIGSLVYGVNTPYVFALNDSIAIPDGVKKSSNRVQEYLSEKIFKKECYVGLLGTHSHRKLSSSEARK